jgi:hypothetical protein
MRYDSSTPSQKGGARLPACRLLRKTSAKARPTWWAAWAGYTC